MTDYSALSKNLNIIKILNHQNVLLPSLEHFAARCAAALLWLEKDAVAGRRPVGIPWWLKLAEVGLVGHLQRLDWGGASPETPKEF